MPLNRPVPACGLYRTTRPLAGRDGNVGAGVLVSFHDHSRDGAPIVLLPSQNVHNRWQFHERGWLVKDDPAFLEGLRPLPPEGYYVLEENLVIGPSETLAERSLVQLGYNREAVPIVFVARRYGATLRFPETGYRLEDSALRLLRPAGFAVADGVEGADVV